MLSPGTSGLVAQMRVLADLTQALLAITDQLQGDVGMVGPHGILLVGVGWVELMQGDLERASAHSMV